MTDRRIVYVYFRADPADDARVDRLLGELHATLCDRWPAIRRAGHGHRHRETPTRRTWLEFYEIDATGDPEALLATRAVVADEIALPAPLDGPVHVEVFEVRGETGLDTRSGARCA
jgi:hypothetical protein